VMAFYNHPLIKFLGEDKYNSKPSYIKKEAFSKVIIDLLKGKNLQPGDDIKPLIQKSIDDGKFAWDNTPIDKETLNYIRSVWTDAQGEVDVFRKSMEQWFDETMERCSGWYKKHTQYILLGIGFLIAVAFNVDSISIEKKLQKDPALRATIVQQADAFTKAHPNLYQERISDLNKNNLPSYTQHDSATNKVKADSIARAKSDSLINRGKELTHKADSLINGDIAKVNGMLGLGWSGLKLTDSVSCKVCICEETSGFWSSFWSCLKCGFNVVGKCLLMFLGWLITALALSLGAPFWFDLLNKLMKLRNSISSPATTQTNRKDEETTTPVIRKG